MKGGVTVCESRMSRGKLVEVSVESNEKGWMNETKGSIPKKLIS
jgi:hypothetical protein